MEEKRTSVTASTITFSMRVASYSKVRDMPFVPCSGKHRSSPIVDTADTFSTKKETFKFCYLTRLNMRKAARLTDSLIYG